MEKNVIFYNSFVDLDTLKDFIGAADVYITPYLNEAQSTSGTLAYTFGSGKPVVSTPYWHAAELSGGRTRRPGSVRKCRRHRDRSMRVAARRCPSKRPCGRALISWAGRWSGATWRGCICAPSSFPGSRPCRCGGSLFPRRRWTRGLVKYPT